MWGDALAVRARPCAFVRSNIAWTLVTSILRPFAPVNMAHRVAPQSQIALIQVSAAPKKYRPLLFSLADDYTLPF